MIGMSRFTRTMPRWLDVKAGLCALAVMFGMGLMPNVALSAEQAGAPVAPGGSAQGGSAPGTPWPGGVWTPGEASYGVGFESGVSVTMSDGVTLKVDVAYPVDAATGDRLDEAFPVLLTQTPYVFVSSRAGDYFVKRGYIFVTAHVRGTGPSAGEYGAFDARESLDGAELVRWAATQLPRSNGRVGLQGNSYMGLNQFFTVAALGANSPVQAMAPSCMGAELYRGTYFAGGVPAQTLNFQRIVGQTIDQRGAASGAALVEEVLSGGPRAYASDPYWTGRDTGLLAKAIVDAGVPALLWSSNGDIYSQSSLELYTYLQNAAAGQPVFGPMSRDHTPTGRYQIIFGQGEHCANIDDRIVLEWFDTWLKDAPTGMGNTTLPIHAQELVSNRWLNTGTFPVVPHYTPYYLTSRGGLDVNRPAVQAKTEVSAGSVDARSLRYETEPFQDGATLAGPISAALFAESTTGDFQLISTLEVIDREGVVTPLSAGTVLASMAATDPRRSWTDAAGAPVRPYGLYDARRPAPPNETRRYEVAIAPRFAAIPPGGRLRLTFTTQTAADKCTPMLGSDACFATAPQAVDLEGSVITLSTGADRSSALYLPLLPAACWRSSDNPGVPYWDIDPALTEAPCQVRSAAASPLRAAAHAR